MIEGDEGFVEATFNAAAPGVFTKTVTVMTDDEARTHVLTFTGEVLAKN